MTEDYRLLLSFIGYGEPKNNIWFIGTEEHSDLNDISNWNSEINRIRNGDIISDKINYKNETFVLRRRRFEEDYTYIGYRRCAKVLEKYYNISENESKNILGRDKSFFTNIFPIPHIKEGKEEPEWFLGRTGINYSVYFDSSFEIRSLLFCKAISLFRPKAIIIFSSIYVEKFISKMVESFNEGLFIDNLSKSKIFPSIIYAYHPGQNMTRVSEDDWVNGITNYLKMISNISQ